MKIFFFVQFFCVFLPPLLNIFCFFRSIPFLSLLCLSCMKCSLAISNFLDEISSLSHSIVFLYFFVLITEKGFLIFPCYSLELYIQMGISFLFSFAFSFFSQLFVSPPQTTILPFCISSSWGWFWSLPSIQCNKPPSIVLGRHSVNQIWPLECMRVCISSGLQVVLMFCTSSCCSTCSW